MTRDCRRGLFLCDYALPQACTTRHVTHFVCHGRTRHARRSDILDNRVLEKASATHKNGE